jgi:hypothetical protein
MAAAGSVGGRYLGDAKASWRAQVRATTSMLERAGSEALIRAVAPRICGCPSDRRAGAKPAELGGERVFAGQVADVPG